MIISLIGLNSVLDYDKFNNANVGQKASQLLLGLLGLQIGNHHHHPYYYY